MNGKELFAMLYDEKIEEDECIKVIHPEEEDHYILRQRHLNKFDDYELLGCLLFQEYKFVIRKQKRVEKYLEKRDKARRIEKLERELSRLKNDN